MLNVFVTEDENTFGTGPILFLHTGPDAALPGHPRSLSWRYFATVSYDDAMLAADREAVIAAVESVGFYVAKRLV